MQIGQPFLFMLIYNIYRRNKRIPVLSMKRVICYFSVYGIVLASKRILLNTYRKYSMSRNIPVRGMLVQLSKLPVHWVDVHVVVLLKVLGKQLNRVITSMKTPLALKDFLHLRKTEDHTLIKKNTFHVISSFPKYTM